MKGTRSSYASALLLALLGPAVGAQSISQLIDGTGDGTHSLVGELSIAVESAVEGSANIYVSGSNSDNVFKIAPGGAIVEIIDLTGDGGNPLSNPADVAVDASGNVYVTGSGSNNAFKITPDGTITEIINDGSGLQTPRGITSDAAGNVYVAGYSSHDVYRIAPDGSILRIIEISGDGNDPLLSPLGLTADRTGNIYVTGSASHNAFRIAPSGAIGRIIDHSGDGANRLESPWGIATDASGNVYVAGSSSDNVFKITPGGVITEIIDGTGDGTHSLVGAVGVVAEGSGNVYVTGGGSGNAFKITPAGKIREIADHTDYSIAVEDSGIVYVAGDLASSAAFQIIPAGLALAQFADSTDLIVPGFEVEAGDPTGATTFFAVRNTADPEVPGRVEYYGRATTQPLRSDGFSLGAQKTLTRNVRDDLSGLDVEDGVASGYIVIRDASGDDRELEGDYFRLDPGKDFATGGRMVRLADFCLEGEVRYVNFGSGTELRILLKRPRGQEVPSFSYTAYNEAGKKVAGGAYSTSNVLSVLDVTDLVAGGNFGTLVFDFSNSGGGWMSAKYSAFGRFSVELSLACLDD